MIPRAIFIAINLICITLCSYMVVDGVYGALTTRLTVGPQPGQKMVFNIGDSGAVRRPLTAYKAVVERNLFGTRAGSAKGSGKLDVAALKETRLNLKLWGTVAGTGDGDYAVIEDVSARKQNLYRVGDSIQTARLKGIFREKVVLTVNGKDEVLQMQDIKSGKGLVRAGQPIASNQPTGGAIRAQRISLRRSYIEQSMTDMAALMTQVQIRPHMENGAPAGLALASIKPNSIFRRMGLRNGDVIVGVDGNQIASVDDALKMVNSLKSASNLTLQLKRRGREKNIEYRIR